LEAPRWLAPLSGVVAMAAGLALAGGTVRARLPVDDDVVWALVSDPRRRPEWVEHVVKVVEGQVDAVHAWRQVDAKGDRFDFRVVEERRPVLVVATARTEDLGMAARWTWRVEDDGGGTLVTVTEEGTIPNPFYRASWQLRRGPYVIVESDLRGLAAALGAPDIAVERLP
jgi:hypothetical protein